MKISYNSEPRKNLIGERLHMLRREKGKSQRELALDMQLHGYSFSELTILRIEKGQRLVTDIELKILCEYFNVEPNQLLGYDGWADES